MADGRPSRARTALAAYITMVMMLQVVPLVAQPAAAADTPELDGVISAGEYEHSAVFDSDQFYFHWTIDDTRIYIGLRAATTGWLALGFDPEDVMKGADMVFGWVLGGTVFVVDAYSTGQFGPHPRDTEQGGTDDLLSYGGTEADGWTTIEFVRRLSTGDPRDKDVPAEGELRIIWAIGGSDDWTSRHVRVGTAAITMETGEAEGEESAKLWPVHAAFMTAGVALMLVGYWTLLQKKKKVRWWFKGHIRGMAAAVACSVVGLATGLYMVEGSTGVHLRVPHTWLGLVTLVLALLTLVNGYAFLRSKERKKQMRRAHVPMGLAAIVLMALTVVSGLFVALWP